MVLFSNLPPYAGINPKGTKEDALAYNLPRMRGGQPHSQKLGAHAHKFTPHARGLTQGDGDGGVLFCIYPACAGITLLCPKRRKIANNLPRVRGDQSREGAAFEQVFQFTPHARGLPLDTVLL